MTTISGPAGHAAISRLPRSRGAVSGLLLTLLGIWGGLVPFLGPQFGYGYTPDVSWTMTWGRLWLEVLPAAATVLGGLVLLTSASRAAGVSASWLATLSGAWLIVGPILSALWSGGTSLAGMPAAGTTVGNAAEAIGLFYGLGAVILFLAATALGRFSAMAPEEVIPVER